MKRKILLLVVACCVVIWVMASADLRADKQPPETNAIQGGVEALMHAKLESAQKLLKGIALEDYESISQQSQQLRLLSLDTGWNILQTKDYARISGEFREAARQINAGAEKKNLDAVGLAYFKLTMTCIDCHRHVRAEQAAE